MEVSKLPPGPLEQIEMLEQLRWLEAGLSIHVRQGSITPEPGIDTEEDLERAIKSVRRKGLWTVVHHWNFSSTLKTKSLCVYWLRSIVVEWSTEHWHKIYWLGPGNKKYFLFDNRVFNRCVEFFISGINAWKGSSVCPADTVIRILLHWWICWSFWVPVTLSSFIIPEVIVDNVHVFLSFSFDISTSNQKWHFWYFIIIFKFILDDFNHFSGLKVKKFPSYQSWIHELAFQLNFTDGAHSWTLSMIITKSE